jgi:hypothetical protein
LREKRFLEGKKSSEGKRFLWGKNILFIYSFFFFCKKPQVLFPEKKFSKLKRWRKNPESFGENHQSTKK